MIFCSERNNTDVVGVTWPRAGSQKSRVGRRQYPHTVGQIVISAYGGTNRGQRDPRALTLTDVRCALDNGCLRHCVSCALIKYFKKLPDGRARQMTIARSKGPKAQ
ncbi:hypothetical protein T09_7230 [Trichinella sp. T9]|nr:hypothetical protein T09_7230 [Trichinella sp. T9]